MKKVLTVLAALALAGAVRAGDEKDLLAGGLGAWMQDNGQAPKAGWAITEGVLTCTPKKAGYIWSKERFGDFTLEFEFKTAGNSGLFFRTGNPRDPVQTGIEMQIDNPAAPGLHSVGAIYDCQAPTKCTAKKDEWNKVALTVKDNAITVVINGETVNEMDLNRWTEAGKNPNGGKNKFKVALKDYKREGHIGFQDHGSAVQYRNIKIRAL